MEGLGEGVGVVEVERRFCATMTPCDVAALKKCLEEHKGNGEKCKEHIAAFKTACSASGASSTSSQRVQGSASQASG